MSCITIYFFSKLTIHHIRHQATHKVGCLPSDCIWSLYSSSGVCVCIYGLCGYVHTKFELMLIGMLAGLDKHSTSIHTW